MKSIYRKLKYSGMAAIALTMLAAVTLLAGVSIPAQAQTYTPLFTFSGDPQWFANPAGSLALGRDGNFYGMTMGGAVPEFYVITPSGAPTKLWTGNGIGWQCFSPTTNSGFTVGPDGLLYGVCWEVDWNQDNAGAVIKFDPSQGQNGVTVLYKFPYGGGCSVQPNSLTLNTDGNFYGTTYGGNCGNAGMGTFFKITPSGTYKLLHTFQGVYGNPQDASYPSAITLGNDGNFYGTSWNGGNTGYNTGTVFKITPKGKVTLLYSFQQKSATDPYNPGAPLTQGADGKWYGTTWQGGAYQYYGTIFQLVKAGTIKVLHSFNMNVDNAAYPVFPLTLGTDRNFYSPSQDTAFGGYGPESIFEITTGKKNVYTDLFNWLLPGQDCNNQLMNGCFPGSPLAAHPNGMFYGTTESGAYPADEGVFYSFNVGFKPYIVPQFPLGKKGTSVGIFGVGLIGTSGVYFNGVSAQFTVDSDTYLTATIPTGATTGYLTVATPSGTLKSATKFKVK